MKESNKIDIFKRNNCKILSFTDIDIPQSSKIIDLKDNGISDFIGLEENSIVNKLILSNNPIYSFRGVPKLRNLEEITMINTPLSNLKNFRIIAFLAFGKQLKKVNEVEITPYEKSIAFSYGNSEVLNEMICRGWIPRGPISTTETASGKQTARVSTNNSPSRYSTRLYSETLKKGSIKGDTSKSPNMSQYQSAFDTLDTQEKDPFSVRAVRTLRAGGVNKEGITSFLKQHYDSVFYPPIEEEKPAIKEEPVVLLEKEAQLIGILEEQIQLLKSKSSVFIEYEKMVQMSGAALVQNAAILNGEQIIEEQKPIECRDEYFELREAVILLLNKDTNASDFELIRALQELTNPEEEDNITELNVLDFGEEDENYAEFDINDFEEDEEDIGVVLKNNDY